MTRRSLAQFVPDFHDKGEEIAYVSRQGYRVSRWTYRQVADLASQFAHELDARSIKKGDRVVLWGPNSAEWVAVFFGCALRGVVVVPMDDVSAPDFVLRVCEQVGARLVVAARRHTAPDFPVSIVLLEDVQASVAVHSTFLSLVSLEPSDPLEIVFTSGTTAEPKGVVITHGNVLANVAPLEEEINKYLTYERVVHPVRFLNLLPLSHVFGQFLGIFLPQLLTGLVIFQDSLSPSEIARTIKQEKVSVLVTVPRVLQSLKAKVERDLESAGALKSFERRFAASDGKHFLRRWWIFRDIHRLFGWKFWAFICGGAALDHETEAFWGRLGYAVVQGYGLTETTSLISVNHPFKLGRGSVGKVLAGREVKLGEGGEILVRGGGVASTYWTGQQLGPVADEDGWYSTGDIGEIDSEGNLYFKGRKKETIVTPAGMNIYPEDLENALRQQPEIRDCAVVGIETQGNAEPCAVLILASESADAGQAVKRANQGLTEYQRIHRWLVWPEQDFPRTSTQKTRRIDLTEWAKQNLDDAPGPFPASSPLAEMIERVTGKAPSNLRPEANLQDDLNLGSLERVELMSALEDRYQVDLSETSFAAANTVADLERLLRGGAAQGTVYHYPRWALRWPWTWIRLIVHYTLLRPAVLLLGWPRVNGRSNLEGVRGPVLVVSNHIDDVDVGYVLTALPARFRHRLAAAAGGEAMEVLRTPAADRGFFGSVLDRVSWFLGAALLNIFPLPRQAGFRQAFAYAGECVDRGYNVLIFPEGHHTKNGKLLPFQSGIGILSNSLQIPIVPIKIKGLYKVKAAGRKFAWPGEVRIEIGSPMQFSANENPASIAQQLQQAVERL